jgi:hypothetical protein
MSKKHVYTAILTLGLAVGSQIALSGPLDPDCTAEKAAKSAAVKGAVGVGGRCSPGEAVKDTAKDAAGIEDKGPIEKAKDGDKNPLNNDKD